MFHLDGNEREWCMKWIWVKNWEWVSTPSSRDSAPGSQSPATGGSAIHQPGGDPDVSREMEPLARFLH
jgi:hypothetical protein